jgi:hypothetical protein
MATVCFTFAIPAAFADPPVYGIPAGSTISVTTPDTKLCTWPAGDPLNPLNKQHHQIRAEEKYTAESINLYPDGFKFDPQGAIGIKRYFQPRTPGTYSLGAASPIDVLTKDMPANSRFNQAQYIQDFGPYAPDQSTFTTTSLATANVVYGVETIELVFDAPARDSNGDVIKDASGKTNIVETVLDYQKIDIYQSKVNNAVAFNVQNFTKKVALNTDTRKPYLGDPPRVIVDLTGPIYPKAEVWVVIYPGNSQTTPPAGAQKVPNTDWTNPKQDVGTYPSGVFIDIGQYINGSGTYTLQAIQKSDTNSFGTEGYGNPASFKINTNYNVSSQLGLVK